MEWKKQGLTDARILEHHPDLTQADLEAAWAYYDAHREEIEQAIKEDAEAEAMARLYADEDFSYPVIQRLR